MGIMIATNYSNARQHFAKYCTEVVRNFETIIITRKNDENVVLMSEANYNNLMENLFIRRDPDEYARLVKSIREYEAGKSKPVKKTLAEIEAMAHE
jgi:antitoxin YefM